MTMKLKKGFTLVELVVVIAVIVILSAILIPTFANVTQKANEAARDEALAGAEKMVLVEYPDLDRMTLVYEYKDKYYIRSESDNSWIEKPSDIAESTFIDNQLVKVEKAADDATSNIKYLKKDATDKTISSSYDTAQAEGGDTTKYLITETFNTLKVYKK